MTKEPWNKNKSVGQKISRHTVYEIDAWPDNKPRMRYLEYTKEEADNRLRNQMFWNEPGDYEIKKNLSLFLRKFYFSYRRT